MRLTLNKRLRRAVFSAGFTFAALFGGLFPSTPLHASDRLFSFIYDTTTAPRGTWELENIVTWKTRRLTAGEDPERGRANEFDFRHEFEYGVTDRFQVALYVADWSVRDDAEHSRNARYDSSALELIYRLTDPNTSFLGSAIYGEVRGGDESLELEGKVILQKNIGPCVVAYNATIESEMEGRHLDERTGEFSQALGVSWELIPQLSVGAEVLHEVEWPGWARPEPQRVFAGPNASVRRGNWFATLTPLFQLTDNRDEPDVQTRLIFGIHF